MTPADLRAALAATAATLGGAVERDWGGAAGDLEWSCRQVVDHLADVYGFYAAHLAARSDVRMCFDVVCHQGASNSQMLVAMAALGEMLAQVADGAPVGARAYHSQGSADRSGFMALACNETMVHTNDIAAGLGLAFAPEPELARRVVARLFPWAPAEGDPWLNQLWASGRTALGDRDRLGPNWGMHPAPLNEWDGTIKQARPMPRCGEGA